jgi:hypothetical protein
MSVRETGLPPLSFCGATPLTESIAHRDHSSSTPGIEFVKTTRCRAAFAWRSPP